MRFSRAFSSIRRLFAALDIHHKSSLNTAVQKYNEPTQRNFKQKLPTHWGSMEYFYFIKFS